MKIVLIVLALAILSSSSPTASKAVKFEEDGTIYINTPNGKKIEITKPTNGSDKNIEISVSGPNIPKKKIVIKDDNTIRQMDERPQEDEGYDRTNQKVPAEALTAPQGELNSKQQTKEYQWQEATERSFVQEVTSRGRHHQQDSFDRKVQQQPTTYQNYYSGPYNYPFRGSFPSYYWRPQVYDDNLSFQNQQPLYPQEYLSRINSGYPNRGNIYYNQPQNRDILENQHDLKDPVPYGYQSYQRPYYVM